MATLTSDEARRRARLLTVQRYDLDLDVTQGEQTFRSTTTIAFTARAAGDTFAELRPHRLHQVLLDGHPLDPGLLEDGRLPLSLDAGEHELRVVADMAYSHTGEGMHRFTDPEDDLTYLYTMCCMAEAPLVYAAFDQPDLKAVFQVAVTAPQDWTVLANGVTTRQPHDEDAPEGTSRWLSAATPPISTYLLAVAAGPWTSVRTEHAGIPFGLHVRQSLGPYLEEASDELLDVTRSLFDRYHQIFDEPYPFDSYDQAFVPEFNAGAMENPGLVTFRDTYIYRSAVTETEREVRAVTIAHEMAHMWFGDLVTLRWWDDIWLNESFAEYMGYQVLQEATELRPWTEFSAVRKPWGYEADQRPTTHPVAPEPGGVRDTAAAWLNFDGISYAKGASALRQLVTWLGEANFLAGINEHFARHRFGNASLDDFIDSLAHATGRDVHTWAEHWLRTPGPDTLTPAVHQDRDGGWGLDIHHTGGRPHRLRVGLFDRGEAPAVVRHRASLDIDLAAEAARSEHRYSGTRPDLVVLNDEDLTYAKTRLDLHSWQTAGRVLSDLPDPLTRIVLWNTARDALRDGELDPAEYLRVVREQLPRESDLAIVQAQLAYARHTVADQYLDDAGRTRALTALEETAQSILGHTAEGSGLRLTAVRTAIDCAATPGTLRSWWEAGAVPGGPDLDHDLRWRLLGRLAVLGATTPDEIERQAARDTSATGQEAVLRCHAALPLAEAKEKAWEDMFGTHSDMSAYLFTATAQGFWQPESAQRELLAPYAERYFAEIAPLAERRGHALTVAAVRAGFPRGFTEAGILERGEHLLSLDTLTLTLRRNLTDRLDDLRRALHVRRQHG